MLKRIGPFRFLGELALMPADERVKTGWIYSGPKIQKLGLFQIPLVET